MDTQLVYFSSYELFLSIVFGLITVFIATRTINILLFRFDDPALYKGNLSTNILSGGLIICTLILVQSSVLPSVDALRTMVLGQEELTMRIIGISLGYFLAFYLLSIVIGILLIYTTIHIHMAATLDVDEIEEIKEDNVAQAVLLAAVLIGMTLFIQEPVARFISSMVDYESLERLQLAPVESLDESHQIIVNPED